MAPNEIKFHSRSATLELIYDDCSQTLSAEYLRVFSPSAEVQGHSPEQAVLQHGKRAVTIRDIEPQGNYAIKLVFSDGHDTGIFSWKYLRDLGDSLDSNWDGYLKRLEEAGKSRNAQFIAVST
ncbi:MAG: DUF971 domain-containing protein [Pseudomonadales bacterium]|jgi:DUF971 family protein